MIASQYPVTTEYGCIKGYPLHQNLCGAGYGFHKGRDRAMPTGTQVVIGDTTIGLSGNTGASTGAHLHIGAYPESTGATMNPKPYEFKIGTVHSTGYTSTNGNYVRVKVGSTIVIYLHLSKILVNVGHVIKEEDNMKMDRPLSIYFWKVVRHVSSPSEEQIKKYIGLDIGDVFKSARAQPWWIRLHDKITAPDSGYVKVEEDLYRKA